MEWLLDSSAFVTRNHCGPGWTPGLIAAYRTANLVTFLAYVTIPLSLFFFYRKKKSDLPSAHVLILFITFIVFCGLGHLGDVVVFAWAPYRLLTLIAALTAATSAATACYLPLVIRYLVKLPSREYVHRINDQFQAEVLRRTLIERELAQRNERMKNRIAGLERLLNTLGDLLKSNADRTLEDLQRTNQWIHERNQALLELNKMLTELEAV